MKGVVASGVSVALFKNPVTSKGIMGYLITVAGVMLYSEVRGSSCAVSVDVAVCHTFTGLTEAEGPERRPSLNH